MITKINKLLSGGLLCCGMAAALTACTDTWDDHFDSLGNAEGGLHEGSLWQSIKNNPDLSNFARVIEGCDYVDKLDGSQVFTVFAPTNSQFSSAEADALIAEYKVQAATELPENNTVIKEFIQNHMALYNHSFSSLKTDTLVLMNGKYAVLGADTTINGVKILAVNQLYSNGVLNTLEKQVAFLPNVFEAFRKDHDYDSVYNFLYNEHYYYKVFQPSQSVAGSIVNGKTQYLDSVFTQRNELYSTLGLINSEDSTYMMVAPTNEVWKNLIEEYEPYFDYPAGLEDRDSMNYTMSRLAIVEGTTFSRTFNEDAALNDSAMSNNCIRNYAMRKAMWGAPFEYYQYYKPKDPKGALQQSEILTCSNGEVRKAREWNIDKRMTFHQYVIADASCLYKVSRMYDTSKKDTVNTIDGYRIEVGSDNKAFYNKLWNNTFTEFRPNNSTLNHTLIYTLPGVLSNIGYDIYVVMAPALAADTVATAEQRRPTKIRFKMVAPGLASAGVALENSNDFHYVAKSKSYEPAADSVCYLKVAENFVFPKCTRGVADETLQAYLNIETNVSNAELRKGSHQRTVRVNCILLVPHESLEVVDELPAFAGTAQGTPGILMYPHGKYDDRAYKAWYMQR
jgi:uncharacterized surface protein with fasciclin (FAS1) repeats